MNFSNKIVVLMLLICPLICEAAFERKGAGTDYIGAGSAGLGDSTIVFPVFNNPALIPQQPGISVSAFVKNYYQISGLNQYNLSVQTGIAGIAAALGIQKFGNNLYSETEIRAGFKFQPLSHLQIGFSLNYYQLHIVRYLDNGSFSLDWGIRFKLNQQFSLGGIWHNINQARIGAAREILPNGMGIGLSYRPRTNLSLLLDIIKQDRFDFDYRIGIHYRLNRWFKFNMGMQQLNHSFCTGFSLKVSSFRGGYAMEYHQTLGLSHAFEVRYDF